MKLDLFAWSEVEVGREVSAPAGRLWLKISAPGAVYVSSEGYEVLLGHGVEFDATLREAFTFRVEVPGKTSVRAFVYAPSLPTFEASGEVFTNADRMVHESGTVLEVRKAMRAFQLEQRAMLRDIKIERAKLRAAKPKPEPEPEPVPEPETTETTGEGEPDAAS